MEDITTALPHSQFGDPACSGFLKAVGVDGRAEIRCHECESVVGIVSAIDVGRELSEMELSLDCGREICSKCGKIHLVPDFVPIAPFACRECGRR